MNNADVVNLFRNIASILEIKGENVFRIRAYERAAQNIEALPDSLNKYIEEGKLTDISGIGKDLADRISEFAKTGKIKAYEELKKSVPEGLLELLNIPSVGPKTARLLYEKLRIKEINGLREAIKKGALKGIPGIKDKTIENILRGIEIVKKGRERMTLAQAQFLADEVIGSLKKLPEIKKISAAGSLRRQKETVGDIDILVSSDKPEKVIGALTGLSLVKDITAHGRTKASIRTKEDLQIDCRVVEERSFGAALMYFSGSKNFNIKLRQLAIKKGLKLNEYGAFRGEKLAAGRSEDEIFKLLGMRYVEPELREDTGEIELALAGRLPDLVGEKDIKGDLHVHSLWSDGSNTVAQMAEAAGKIGYSYIASTDHSKSLKVARGLSIADLRKKRREIDKLNSKLRGFRVLFGTEVDIDSQGGIDYPDSVLKDFDVVVAAIHTGFKQAKPQLTKRIVNACKNKFVHIISHPTGRLWGTRDAYPLDLNEVFNAASGTNTHLEINAFPNRLDLNDMHCRMAKEMNVKLAINTDSHSTEQLLSIKFGLAVARRAWLTKEDVINTLPVEKLLAALKKS